MKDKRIYIVEDEAIIALEIKRHIINLGFTFAGMASNYQDALQGILQSKPDLVLLDIMLRQSKSGIEVARALENVYPVPVIFLTSVTNDETMQEAIATTPASYLLKPFRREELYSAILLGLHKRTQYPFAETATIDIGSGYRYQLERNLLLYKDQPIILSIKERRLLGCLIQAKSQIVSFKVLEETVWQGSPVSESALRTLRYRLHKKLHRELIETIPLFGYRIHLKEHTKG